MGKKLFVGGLPFATTSEELEKLFADAGTVESANVITDRMTGRSRGFGFVELSSDEEAKTAIEKLNGNKVGDRAIIVSEAKPHAERPGPRSTGKQPQVPQQAECAARWRPACPCRSRVAASVGRVRAAGASLRTSCVGNATGLAPGALESAQRRFCHAPTPIRWPPSGRSFNYQSF